MTMYVIRSEEQTGNETIVTLICYSPSQEKVLKKMIELTNNQKDQELIYLTFNQAIRAKMSEQHKEQAQPADFEIFRQQKLTEMEEAFKNIGANFLDFHYGKNFIFEPVPEL